jgi:hypothetical protein
VLLNFNWVAVGFTAPYIDAVFLARPTTSSILCAQMIGRGSRLAPGKEHYSVVEFTDTLRRFGSAIFHARELPEVRSTPPGHLALAARPARHDEPRDEPRFADVWVPGMGRISYAENQTFGVEIELSARGGVPRMNQAWHLTARTIQDRIREATRTGTRPSRAPGGERGSWTEWRVVRDESAGWEVVSPILANAEGLEELGRVCAALTDLVASSPRLRVNFRTGMHLTLGTRINTNRRLRAFLTRLQRLEPGLFTLVSPSRLFGFDRGRYDVGARNYYCLPVRESDPDIERVRLRRFARGGGHRYRSVNGTHAYEDVQTLEVRLHNGTTEFRKIAPLDIPLDAHLQPCPVRVEWPGRPGPRFSRR